MAGKFVIKNPMRYKMNNDSILITGYIEFLFKKVNKN